MTILEEIFQNKHEEVRKQKNAVSIEVLKQDIGKVEPPLDFLCFSQEPNHKPALIAEIKRASPSRGDFAMNVDPVSLARVYSENGAAAISVLTENKYFKGSLEYLRAVRKILPNMPLLRKDFICDPYQVYESRAAGADAVLLIVAGILPDLLNELFILINTLGMTALIEVHNEPELEIALHCRPSLIGVNNRDLRDFSVNLETSKSMRSLIPDSIMMVSESGIHNQSDVEKLAQVNVDAILVGEAIVTAVDIGKKVRELSGWYGESDTGL